MTILNNIKKNLFSYIVMSMVLGLVVGKFNNVAFMKSAVSYVLFLMVYPMMINMNIVDVLKSFTNFKIIGISLVLNFIISPIIVVLLGNLFFRNSPELFLGFLLIGLLPASGMAASWTGIAKGNIKMTLVMMSMNLLASILFLPIYLNLFAGSEITIDTGVIIMSLIKVVLIPLVLGDLTRRVIIKSKGIAGFNKLKPSLSGISSAGVIVIVFIAMALKSKIITSQISLVLYSFIPIIIYYAIQIIISHSIGRKILSREDRVALVYTISLRNLTIALGIAMASFGNSLSVLIITIAYIVQTPIGTLYMKYSDKIENKNNTIENSVA